MIQIRRLTAVGAILAAGAIIACSSIWAQPGSEKELKALPKDGKSRPAVVEKDRFAPDLERNNFGGRSVIVYDTVAGERLFALQVQPKLADAPVLPVDYLVLIDTSASKALGALATAQKLVTQLRRQLGNEDRLALWTANIKPKDLSRGFTTGKPLDEALLALNMIVPLGAVDLKKALDESLASFEGRPTGVASSSTWVTARAWPSRSIPRRAWRCAKR